MLKIAGVLAGALLCAGMEGEAAAGPSSRVMLEHSSDNLALSRLRDVEVLSLTLLSQPGRTAVTAAAVQALGGRVHYRFAPADFLHAMLPARNLDALLARAPLESVTVDAFGKDYLANRMLFSQTNESPASAVDARPDWPLKPGAYPLDRPYDVLADLDGRVLRQSHPTYDGRGVTIAHVEVNFTDFLLPELRYGATLEGKRVPKFIDIINVPALRPGLEPDPEVWSEGWTGWQWGRLGVAVERRDDGLEHAGKRYRVPRADRAYRLGEIDIPTRYLVGIGLAEGSLEGQGSVSRGTAVRTALPMLWSEAKQTLWLDVNRNGDFTDETPVAPFSRGQTFGVIGTDDPQTDVRESIGYAVQKVGNDISLSFGISGHGAIVAGAAAGYRGEAGRLEGIAPGARFIAIGGGDTTSAYGQALIRAFSDPRTDLVLVEAFAQISGFEDVLKQGRSTLAVLLARLSREYRKPCLITSGNYHGMSTIIDMSAPAEVMAVSAYQSAQGTLINEGVRLAHADNLHGVGGEGPAGNGALKPDFLAPANPITLEVGFMRAMQGRSHGLFQLPPGYAIGGGTSTATPVAAGAAAVLVSAAKQNRLPHDAAAIQGAMQRSARVMSAIPMYKQGNGLVQIGAAWASLRARSAQQDIAIVSVAPVRTVASHLLPTPGSGSGWFEREGWRAGQAQKRTVTFTRKTGPKAPMRFEVRWQGDSDGAFSSAAEVNLPLGEPVKFEVAAHPKTVGAHSALLELHNAAIDGPAHRLAATIVAAYEFDAGNAYRFEGEARIAPLDRQNFYFRVPEGADAFTVTFAHNTPNLRVKVTSPDKEGRGYHIDPVQSLGRVSFGMPRAGVWEVAVFDTGRDAFDWNTAHQTAPATKVSLQADITGVSVTQAAADRFEIVNRYATFQGGVASGNLGSLLRKQARIRPGEQQVYELELEAGATLLAAEIDVADASVAPELTLYDCTAAEGCTGLRRSDAGQKSRRVAVENPAAGRWRIVVDAIGMEGDAPLSYEYRDYFTHPRLGSFSSTDTLTPRSVGERWTVQTRSWQGAGVPPAGRVPVALVAVEDPLRYQLHMRSSKIDIPALAIMPYAFSNLDRLPVPMGLKLLELPMP